MNGEVLVVVGPLPKVEQFFSNEARLLDDDFTHVAGWTALRRFGPGPLRLVRDAKPEVRRPGPDPAGRAAAP